MQQIWLIQNNDCTDEIAFTTKKKAIKFLTNGGCDIREEGEYEFWCLKENDSDDFDWVLRKVELR